MKKEVDHCLLINNGRSRRSFSCWRTKWCYWILISPSILQRYFNNRKDDDNWSDSGAFRFHIFSSLLVRFNFCLKSGWLGDMGVPTLTLNLTLELSGILTLKRTYIIFRDCKAGRHASFLEATRFHDQNAQRPPTANCSVSQETFLTYIAVFTKSTKDLDRRYHQKSTSHLYKVNGKYEPFIFKAVNFVDRQQLLCDRLVLWWHRHAPLFTKKLFFPQNIKVTGIDLRTYQTHTLESFRSHLHRSRWAQRHATNQLVI